MDRGQLIRSAYHSGSFAPHNATPLLATDCVGWLVIRRGYSTRLETTQPGITHVYQIIWRETRVAFTKERCLSIDVRRNSYNGRHPVTAESCTTFPNFLHAHETGAKRPSSHDHVINFPSVFRLFSSQTATNTPQVCLLPRWFGVLADYADKGFRRQTMLHMPVKPGSATYCTTRIYLL